MAREAPRPGRIAHPGPEGRAARAQIARAAVAAAGVDAISEPLPGVVGAAVLAAAAADGPMAASAAVAAAAEVRAAEDLRFPVSLAGGLFPGERSS